jgi:hypothetical protein
LLVLRLSVAGLEWEYTDIVFALSVPDEIYCFVHDLNRDNQSEFSRQRDFEVRGSCLKGWRKYL